MPPKKGGPWQLEQVKLRLRAEQVAREREAGARQRAIEEEEARVRQTRTPVQANNSWAECTLCLLVLCCLLLCLSVLLLSSVVLASLKH